MKIKHQTLTTIVKEEEREIDKIAKTYKELEKTGHLDKGQISETVNWDEIKSHLRSSILRVLEGVESEIKLKIADECNTARSEEQPTSRLTSLFNKLSEFFDAEQGSIKKLTE